MPVTKIDFVLAPAVIGGENRGADTPAGTLVRTNNGMKAAEAVVHGEVLTLMGGLVRGEVLEVGSCEVSDDFEIGPRTVLSTSLGG